jgi:DedD protein
MPGQTLTFMGLLSFFRRDDSTKRKVQRSRESVELIRVRARRRLIGAVVLVLAAVLGLPLLLETQPRPLSADIGIDVAREVQTAEVVVATQTERGAAPGAAPSPAVPALANGGAASPADAASAVAAAALPAAAVVMPPPRTVAPPARPGGTPVPSLPIVPMSPGARPVPGLAVVAPTRRLPDVVTAPVRPPAAHAAPAPRVGAEARAPVARPVAPPAVPAARSDDPARAKALSGANAKPAAATASPRFVVQVGAFEHAAAAHDTRGKVEKLGLKAYEQAIDAGGSRRIRVRLGPFASREEAERTLQKLRASGMTASVMPL